jgi:hypothetical protein
MKRIFFYIAINVLPVAALLLILADVFDALSYPSRYPFGSEFFSPYSIYSNKILYFYYNVVTGAVLFTVIVLSFFKHRRLYFLFILISLILFLYPIFIRE